MKPPKKEAPPRLYSRPDGTKLIVDGSSTPGASVAETAFFANYAEYAKTLRAWLVAYGIGGPVLFLTNKDLSTAFKLSPYRNLIVDLFLLGVALQVVLAFINKWCAWHMYVGEYDESFKSNRAYRVWSWLNDRSWIDLVVDGASLIAFAVSTTLVIRVFS
jgi:hypothetical protein